MNMLIKLHMSQELWELFSFSRSNVLCIWYVLRMLYFACKGLFNSIKQVWIALKKKKRLRIYHDVMKLPKSQNARQLLAQFWLYSNEMIYMSVDMTCVLDPSGKKLRPLIWLLAFFYLRNIYFYLCLRYYNRCNR